MPSKLLSAPQVDSLAASILKLKAYYKQKYAWVRPGHSPVPTIMFHSNSIHVLIDGKLKETLAYSQLKEIDKLPTNGI